MADTPMRPETTSEHIARDMREGRFPEQSERQMVPVKADLPAEIMVWKSNPGLDHLGTWATERYPEEAVAYVPLETCNARVAAELAALQDPLVVHLNMVAGKIAKPLPSQLVHIYGEDTIRAALDAMIGRAREVKPLAWLSGWFCDQEAFYADTAVGNWAVVQYSSRNGRWAYDDPSGETSDEDWESASLAQAAVHLEHTARIHAALRANAMDASEGER